MHCCFSTATMINANTPQCYVIRSLLCWFKNCVGLKLRNLKSCESGGGGGRGGAGRVGTGPPGAGEGRGGGGVGRGGGRPQ